MKRFSSASLFVLLALFCGNVLGQTAPKLLPFQGRLTDQNGGAVSNGVRLVQFKIYDVPTGGSPAWAGELHRTTVNGGLVNVMLGSKTPFTGVDFDRQLYLEITVDVSGSGGTNDNAITLADPPMLPRQAILPVVFAKEAADSRKLNGSDWTAIFGANNPNLPIPASKLADASLPAVKIQSSSITSNQISPQTINASLIAPGTITSNQIANGAIDVSDLAQQVAEALVPPGTIISFGGTSVPTGWLLCGGSAVSRSQYPRLFAAIDIAWGAGDGSTTFSLPDLRGVFLRGIDNAAGRDPDVGSRTNKSGATVGNAVGSYQDDAFKSHGHKQGDPQSSNLNRFGTWETFTASQIRPQFDYGVGAFPLTDSAGGSETRPKNAYVNFIIKY